MTHAFLSVKLNLTFLGRRRLFFGKVWTNLKSISGRRMVSTYKTATPATDGNNRYHYRTQQRAQQLAALLKLATNK
jgi:hypothetical protein